MAVSGLGITFLDKAGESSRVKLNMPLATAGTIAGLLTECDSASPGSLAAAICAVTTCAVAKTDVIASEKKGTSVKPTDNFAHRELGLLVRYSDNVTGEKYHVTIPGPNLANIPILAHDEADMTAQALVDLKTAMEAHVVSPVGNAITVDSARLVGRAR